MTATAAPFPIEETTIATLHAAYLSGRATAVSVCQAHLDRIAAYDRKGPALGAIIINNPDALADAAALDAALESTGRLVGPLHGVPVLVKAGRPRLLSTYARAKKAARAARYLIYSLTPGGALGGKTPKISDL